MLVVDEASLWSTFDSLIVPLMSECFFLRNGEMMSSGLNLLWTNCVDFDFHFNKVFLEQHLVAADGCRASL